jgi:hypothetical protein
VTYLNSTDDIDRSHYAHMDSRRIMCEYWPWHDYLLY